MALLGFKEAEKELGVSHWMLRRKAAEGVLKTVYIGRRRLISEEEISRIKREGLPSLTANADRIQARRLHE